MKIGVILSAYDSEKYIQQVLEPWMWMKENSDHDIIIAASNGQWLKFKEAGVEPTNDKTGQILLDSKIDFMYRITGDNVVSEEESRSILLRYLQYHQCDLIWLLDGDEVYDTQEILNIIKYVEFNPQYDCFRVNFKNYTLKLPMFVKDFVRATVYRDKIRGGLWKFVFDTDASYKDGSVPDTIPTNVIPRGVAFPKHYTWLKEDKRSFEKIIHQEHKFIWSGKEGYRCAYKIHDKDIEFNEKFWKSRGLQLPILREEGDVYSHLFNLNYNRVENRIDITDIQRDITLRFDFYDLVHETLIYEIDLKLGYGSTYWVMPSITRNFGNEEDFVGFKVEVKDGNELIHQEKLYLRV
jgi:hypothetical protein